MRPKSAVLQWSHNVIKLIVAVASSLEKELPQSLNHGTDLPGLLGCTLADPKHLVAGKTAVR